MSEHAKLSRRDFLNAGLGGVAAGLVPGVAGAQGSDRWTGALASTHHTPRAKRVIWLYMAGGPSQIDLFDYKAELEKRDGEMFPESLTKGQQIAQLQGKELRVFGPQFKHRQYGESGIRMTSLLPYIGNNVADKMCLINSMRTEQINHDTAHMFMNTGSQVAGRPSFGSWIDYGLGGMAGDLPPYVVMVSKEVDSGSQPLSNRQWNSGFLPSRFQGIEFQSGRTPVYYLDNPGTGASHQEFLVDQIRALNDIDRSRSKDPESVTRNLQYEMAYRMQHSLPNLASLDDEPDYIKNMYGLGKGNDSFARNCLLARKMAESGVRVIQLYHRGWDHHKNLSNRFPKVCKSVDQGSAALVLDLEQRGLLEDTLVIWGGEFGRTPMGQNGDGRDHHIQAFSMWMAGAGIKPGIIYGETDPFGYNIIRDEVHVHDFHATIMHLMGIDHEKLRYRYQGRDFRLTDVHGHVVKNILA